MEIAAKNGAIMAKMEMIRRHQEVSGDFWGRGKIAVRPGADSPRCAATEDLFPFSIHHNHNCIV